MPNWVDSVITVHGEPSRIAEAVAVLRAPRPFAVRPEGEPFGTPSGIEMTEIPNGQFSFWGTSHPDEEQWPMYFGLIETDRLQPFWYQWNNAWWGTKWDACDAELLQDYAGGFMLRFSTAWSFPEPWLNDFAEMFPDLDYEVEWEEEQGYGARLVWVDGDFLVADQWAIPTSHADLEDRDRECLCVVYNERMFDDCPEVQS